MSNRPLLALARAPSPVGARRPFAPTPAEPAARIVVRPITAAGADDERVPAGGMAHTPAHVDRFAKLMSATHGRGSSTPQHLRSSFRGAAMLVDADATASSRAARPSSPRYLQHTSSSAGRITPRAGDEPPAQPARLVDPSRRPPTATTTAAAAASAADPANAEATAAANAAGGSPNHRRDFFIDFGQAPRRLKRTTTRPSPSAGGRPVPLVASHDTAASFDKSIPNERAPRGAISSHDKSIPNERPARDGIGSHDKSIPNSPRSRRASGKCQPPAASAVSAEALAAATPVLLSGAGALYGSAALPRRSRSDGHDGRPQSAGADPNRAGPGVAACPGDAAATGLGSRLCANAISPSRRARGSCSPMRERRTAPFPDWM